MFKVKDLICLILVALSVTISSCSKDEPESPSSDSDNNKVVINSDGSASGGAVFSRIDENTFWLDYVKYKIVDSHLEIIGYDPTELPQKPTLYSEVTLNGANLKTRIVGKSAFYEAKCTSLSLPESISELHRSCFAGSSLKNISFGRSKITRLPEFCFYGTNIETFSIPAQIIEIGESCFSHCTSLKSLSFEGTNITCLPDYCLSYTALESFEIPSHIIKLGEGCFAGCPLFSINTGNCSLSQGCFKDCSLLFEVTLNSVIPNDCFYWCQNLHRITCYTNVSEIALDAFTRCYSLEEIFFYGLPPDLNKYDKDGNFGGSKNELSLATAYVPKDLLDIYLQELPSPYEDQSFCAFFKEILPMP